VSKRIEINWSDLDIGLASFDLLSFCIIVTLILLLLGMEKTNLPEISSGGLSLSTTVSSNSERKKRFS